MGFSFLYQSQKKNFSKVKQKYLLGFCTQKLWLSDIFSISNASPRIHTLMTAFIPFVIQRSFPDSAALSFKQAWSPGWDFHFAHHSRFHDYSWHSNLGMLHLRELADLHFLPFTYYGARTCKLLNYFTLPQNFTARNVCFNRRTLSISVFP